MWGIKPSVPNPPLALALEPRRTSWGIARLLVCLAGGLCVAALALLLQLALAHPAGAATLPVSGLLGTADTLVASSPAPAVVSAVGQTVGTVDQAASPVVSSVTTPVLNDTPVSSVLQPATQTVDTLTGSLGGAVANIPLPVGSLPLPVGSLPLPVGSQPLPVGRTVGLGLPLGQAGNPTTLGRSVTGAPTVTLGTTTSSPSLFGPDALSSTLVPAFLAPSRATAFNVALGGAPGQVPAPQRRSPPFFPSPAPTTTDASSPAHGSSPLDALPPMGLLLPALIVFGLLFGRQRNPLLLFDTRFAPPG